MKLTEFRQEIDVLVVKLDIELRELHASAELAKQQLAALQTPCIWTEPNHDGVWLPSCPTNKHSHNFHDLTPTQYDHLYCPHCGHVIQLG